MKIMNFALAFAASLLIFTSCSNEADEIADVNKDVKVKKVFGIGTQASVSRTTIVDWPASAGRALNVDWQDDDKLTIFAENHSAGDEFEIISSTKINNAAQFEGYTFNEGPYYIIHPAQEGARLIEADKVRLNIPATQSAVKNSFDPNANVLIGKTSSVETSTDLMNVCAYFYITVPANCTSVKIKTINPKDGTWYLAGNVTVSNIGSGGNHISYFDGGSDEIEMTGFTETATYFISFIPTSGMKADLEVSVHTTEGVYNLIYHRPNTGEFSFTAGSYYNLGDFTPKNS